LCYVDNMNIKRERERRIRISAREHKDAIKGAAWSLKVLTKAELAHKKSIGTKTEASREADFNFARTQHGGSLWYLRSTERHLL